MLQIELRSSGCTDIGSKLQHLPLHQMQQFVSFNKISYLSIVDFSLKETESTS